MYSTAARYYLAGSMPIKGGNMSIGTIAALICIVFGFIAGFSDEDVLFNPLTWFVAAIAFDLALDFDLPWRREA